MKRRSIFIPTVTQAIARRATRLLHWVLLLAVAWQGPIPWCHCHGSLASSTAQSSSWLANHLQSYHPTTALLSNQGFGWHFHAILPKSSNDDPNQRSDTDQNRHPTPDVTASFSHWLAHCARVSTSSLAAFEGPIGGCGAVLLAPAWRVRHTAHFYASFAPTLPLPLRFGVQRT